MNYINFIALISLGFISLNANADNGSRAVSYDSEKSAFFIVDDRQYIFSIDKKVFITKDSTQNSGSYPETKKEVFDND